MLLYQLEDSSLAYIKVWWHDATLFVNLKFYSASHSSVAIAGQLSGINLPTRVPSDHGAEQADALPTELRRNWDFTNPLSGGADSLAGEGEGVPIPSRGHCGTLYIYSMYFVV
jgi:hypothetical protein